MKHWVLRACALGTLASCAGQCGSDATLAEVTELSGHEIDRDHAQHEESWKAAVIGDRFEIGDGLRTGADSTALLALMPSGQAKVEPHTVLRFLESLPAQPSRSLAVETGSVEIVARQMDVEVHTPRAITRVSPGSAVRLSAVEGQERFDLVVGRVLVAHEGVSAALERDQPLVLSQDTRDDQVAAEDAGRVPSATDAGRLPDASLSTADDDTLLSSDSRFDLALHTLEDATIHAPAPPVLVRLTPPSECMGRASLSIDGRTADLHPRGSVLRLQSGTHRVRLLCGDAAVSTARLRVQRDPAMLDLPKRAQNVRVEADGRHYAVHYQNLLPVVSFVWPRQKSTGTFSLVVTKGSKQTLYKLEHPEHALASGTLGEGAYKFWFRDDNGHASPPTTLRLSFDNTARSAYLSAPVDGSHPDASGVSVAGAALLRSHVFVQGQPVELDGKGRFRTETQPLPGQDGIFVRVDHPEGGVHYYLRRLR